MPDRLERIRSSPNFRDGIFKNLVGTTMMVPGSTLKVARDWLAKKNARPPKPLPTVAVTRESFAAPPPHELRLCWLGHSSVLLEVEGKRVLFAPVWAKRSSPWQAVGPRRFQPVPLALDQVPRLDAVAISHDHFDHLDQGAIQALAKSDPALPFLVPLGVGARLEAWGVPPERIRECDWWDEVEIAGLRFIAAPARHFSGRGLLDRNKTLWTSWIVLGSSRRVYFGGDGGYFPLFAELGALFGPFDLTMLEIGAFHPNWGFIHLGPENALKAHADLRGRVFMPIHWGGFDLAVHAWDEPITTLLRLAPQGDARLLVPRIGQLVHPADPPAVETWWDAAR